MTWVRLPTGDSAAFSQSLSAAVAQRISSGSFSAQDVANIRNRDLELIPKDLSLPPELLEKLRRLCQLWEVDLRSANIYSHRRLIGPFIVAAKKIIYPILRFVLKDFIREQRDFNAEVISFLAVLANESRRNGQQ